MKALSVDAYWINRINGAVLLELSYAWEAENPLGYIGPMSSVEAADAYILSMKRSWVLNAFETFLNHKKAIIKAYPQEEKNKLFSDIWLGYCEMVDYSWNLEKICGRILKGEAALKKILPGAQNPSFESSTKNLQEIISFCKNELKNNT